MLCYFKKPGCAPGLKTLKCLRNGLKCFLVKLLQIYRYRIFLLIDWLANLKNFVEFPYSFHTWMRRKLAIQTLAAFLSLVALKLIAAWPNHPRNHLTSQRSKRLHCDKRRVTITCAPWISILLLLCNDQHWRSTATCKVHLSILYGQLDFQLA